MQSLLVDLQPHIALLASQLHVPARDEWQAQVYNRGPILLQEGADVVPESACVHWSLPLNPRNPGVHPRVHQNTLKYATHQTLRLNCSSQNLEFPTRNTNLNLSK